VRRVRHYVPANAARCIPRVRLPPARARSASVRDFHLRDRCVRAAVRELPRDVPVSAMFRVV